jgi:hypothetical protein
MYTTQKFSISNYLVREDPQVLCRSQLSPAAAATAAATLRPEKKEKCLPQLVPLLRTGRRSKAVGATVLFDVLSNVLPGKLGAASADVRTFRAELLGMSDATTQEADLSI